MGVITAPELLTPSHQLEVFDCGKAILNDWLKRRARKANQVGSSARTYVACSAKNRVVAYYSLSTGAVDRDNTPGKVSRNMPNPIPVVLLGRLAVDTAYAGQGVGTGLLKDALMRVVHAAGQIGVRAVLVHALDEDARGFYLKRGFYDSPTNDMTLMITVNEIEQAL